MATWEACVVPGQLYNAYSLTEQQALSRVVVSFENARDHAEAQSQGVAQRCSTAAAVVVKVWLGQWWSRSFLLLLTDSSLTPLSPSNISKLLWCVCVCFSNFVVSAESSLPRCERANTVIAVLCQQRELGAYRGSRRVAFIPLMAFVKQMDNQTYTMESVRNYLKKHSHSDAVAGLFVTVVQHAGDIVYCPPGTCSAAQACWDWQSCSLHSNDSILGNQGLITTSSEESELASQMVASKTILSCSGASE